MKNLVRRRRLALARFLCNRCKTVLARFLLLLCLAMPGLALAEPAFVYLVRHGEKEAGQDPALTSQGQQRAKNIASLLRRAGVKQVFSSQTLRTMQTAQAMAQVAGVEVIAYDASKPQALVARVHAIDGGAVLVVGHSDTLSELVRLFGGAPGADIGDLEFDRVYQLTRGADGKVVTVLLSSLP